MSNVFDSGGDGILSGEQGVYDNTETFHLEVSLIQGFKWASIIKVVVKWDGQMGVHDSSDQGGVFSGGWEQAELVAVYGDIDREDRGNFYSRWRRSGNYGGGR